MNQRIRLTLALGALVVLCSCLCAAWAFQVDRSNALQSLADAERAFAAQCVQIGIRDSFLANFADDGIHFTPEPSIAKEDFSRQPKPATKSPYTLNWAPIYTDVSSAADMGFNTGPYVLSDDAAERPPQYGTFFSIWKRQNDGTWKVALDMGVKTVSKKDPTAGPKWEAASDSGFVFRGRPNMDAERNALLTVEKEFSDAAGRGPIAAYSKYLSDDCRAFRDGVDPVLGRAAIVKSLSGVGNKLNWQVIGSDLAKSADFGYTYGRYESFQPAGKGFYTHVWKRNVKGQWKLSAEVLSALPREAKK